jgi:3-hydroxybutyryl-CoA dehydrogenase
MDMPIKTVICCNEESKRELLSHSILESNTKFVQMIEEGLKYTDSRVIIDLSFECEPARIELLRRSGKTVVVNSVVETLKEIDPSFSRINGWPGFLISPVIEIAGTEGNAKHEVMAAFSVLNKKLEWLPDEAGLISAKVISTIINEAYFALSEGVSSREDINVAMKLGTAYPFGPFEWATRIGLRRIAALLLKLSNSNPRYQPSELLLKEALGRIN